MSFELILQEFVDVIGKVDSAAQSNASVVVTPTTSAAQSAASTAIITGELSVSSQPLLPALSASASAANVAVVAESLKKTPSIKEQYETKYTQLKSEWKKQYPGYNLEDRYKLFFDMSDFVEGDDIAESSISLSSGILTEQAVQALQWRFAMNNTSAINLINHTEELQPITNLVTVKPDNSVELNMKVLKEELLDPSVRYTQQPEKEIYARIVKVGSGATAKYLVVAIQQHGQFFVLDPSNITKPYARNFVAALSSGLNAQKNPSSHVKYSNNSNNFIYGGIQGGDEGSTADGIFSFAYWAAIMSANTIDGYKSLNGFQAERSPKLNGYANLAVGAVYSKKVEKMPTSVSSQAFEEDIREWLRREATSF